MNKKSALLQLVEKGYRIYVATQPKIFKELTIGQELRPHVQFIDCLLAKNRDWYNNKITELNKRIFGPQAMATDKWVDHHFGIAAGVTLGFLDFSGEPISMMRFIRHFTENSIHEWTFLRDTKYRGMGFSQATLALGCEFSKDKKRISFTTQLDNSAMSLYFCLTNEGNPLELLAIGFHHTHPNSIMAITDIPKNSESIMRKYEMPPISEGILLKKGIPLIPGKYLILASDLDAIKRISEDLGRGSKYKIIGWYQNSKELGVEEPLTMVEKRGD